MFDKINIKSFNMKAMFCTFNTFEISKINIATSDI